MAGEYKSTAMGVALEIQRRELAKDGDITSVPRRLSSPASDRTKAFEEVSNGCKAKRMVS